VKTKCKGVNFPFAISFFFWMVLVTL
jgi:hypothetical protein